jgi:hypothetical protein
MVAGWANRAEHIVRPTSNDEVNAGDDSARRAQSGFARARRDMRVLIDLDKGNAASGRRDGVKRSLDHCGVVDAGERLKTGARRFMPLQCSKLLCVERGKDGAQAINALGMAERRLMLETGRMSDEGRDHKANLTWPRTRLISPV